MELARHPLDRTGECARIPRSQITEASYNPRTLSTEQKRRLKKVLEKHGLCTPLVWNKRSGVLCGGHQRLTILDSLYGDGDWAVPVTILDIDEAQERELNIALNNQESAGQFDFAKLGTLFTGPIKLDIEATGFDATKLRNIIPQIVVNLPDMAAGLESQKVGWREGRKKAEERVDAAVSRMADRADAFTPGTAEVAKPADSQEAAIYESDDDFYIAFVFPDALVAGRVKELMGLDVASRDHDGRVLMQMAQELKELKGAK